MTRQFFSKHYTSWKTISLSALGLTAFLRFWMVELGETGSKETGSGATSTWWHWADQDSTSGKLDRQISPKWRRVLFGRCSCSMVVWLEFKGSSLLSLVGIYSMMLLIVRGIHSIKSAIYEERIQVSWGPGASDWKSFWNFLLVRWKASFSLNGNISTKCTVEPSKCQI